ncbi:Glycosyltransferase involved in LPS biosynthesis [Paraburkholderia sabiae]|uniref:glycosyltransferase family 25 protein n=1 Tax=Paraburkholderia sabiae TaxID=273251 RepID=UPI001CAC104F|nr:glycosyltransferase family 25 protein [Paraburkholderia sabiae]CAG9220577.1 Glycosyltransferase involved in LPS biosynthesis [Paraburkholderia sabiae]
MLSQLPVKVISLQRSGRRQRIAETLSTHCVDFDFVDAVDANEIPTSDFDRLYDDAAARLRYGRSLSKGEVACFVSHRRLWEAVAASEHGVIVLEDDALLDLAFFKKVVRWHGRKLSHFADIVLLGRSKLSRSSGRRAYLYEPLKRSQPFDGMTIGLPFKQWTSGSVGYWISPRGAALALAHSVGPVRALLDDWPWHRDGGSLRIMELRPYVVWEGFESIASDIEAERNPLISGRTRWKDLLLEPLRFVRLVLRWSIATVIRVIAKFDTAAAVNHD